MLVSNEAGIETQADWLQSLTQDHQAALPRAIMLLIIDKRIKWDNKHLQRTCEPLWSLPSPHDLVTSPTEGFPDC